MRMHFIGSVAFLTFFTLVLAGCDSNSTDSGEDYLYASVRFIHSSPSTELIDFAYLVYDADYYADVATEVSYGEQRGYFAFVADSRTFRAYNSGSSLSVAKITRSLTENCKYTIIANDLEAAINPSLLAVADTNGTPDSGKVLVRFIHLSADAPDLDILSEDSSLLIANLGHCEASGYVVLDAGTYEFTAVSSGTDTELLTLDPMTLTLGVNYSVILSGSAYGLPGPQLNARIYYETGVE